MSRVVAVAVVALVAVLGVETWYLAGAAPAPTSQRPVVVGTQTARSYVDLAAQQTSAILSYGYEDFDAQLEDATARMTPSFAAEFEERVSAERERFGEERITQEARVVDSAVVSADEGRVIALVFVDQYVARAGAGTTVQPRRVLVTAVRQDGVWLVDGMSLV